MKKMGSTMMVLQPLTALTMSELYMVIDLSGGSDATNYSVAYLDMVHEEGWTDNYKGDKMVVRLIAPGALSLYTAPHT